MVTGTAGESVPAHAELTRQIRAGILNAEFAPHQRLIEADLIERFDVTRGAVRKALLNLAGEGLVELLPNRGARVRAVSAAEAIEIVEVRIELETLCVRRAAENASDADIAELRTLRTEIEEAFESGDLQAYEERHQQMDLRIRELSAHATAVHLIERLRAQAARHQFRGPRSVAEARASVPEHLAIIDAVIDREPARAASATRDHLEKVVDRLRAMS